MQHLSASTPQAVEIRLLEQLIERTYAHLWHFAIAREKELQRITGSIAEEGYKKLKHQKQKRVYRDCVGYASDEASRVLSRIWHERADMLYAQADFGGLLQLRQRIETHRHKPLAYFEILQERLEELQDEIDEMRESGRQLRISAMRERQMPGTKSC